MTNNCDSFDSAVMMSSEIPSAKYSCSTSPLMLAKGSTAIESFFGAAESRRLGRAGSGGAFIDHHAKDLNGPRNVLDGEVPAVLDPNRHLVTHLVGGGARDEDAAGLGQCLKPGGNIDAVSIDVVAIYDDVADIDADPKPDPVVSGFPALWSCTLF